MSRELRSATSSCERKKRDWTEQVMSFWAISSDDTKAFMKDWCYQLHGVLECPITVVVVVTLWVVAA